LTFGEAILTYKLCLKTGPSITIGILFTNHEQVG
jgi:hypothetical protein